MLDLRISRNPGEGLRESDSMRYVAVLECPFAGLAEFARCFTSDLCRVTELNGLWVLKSSIFNACSAPVDVFPLADKMLSVVRRIMSLYFGLICYPITTNSIRCIDDEGRFCGNTIRGSLNVMIVSPTAISELTKPINGKPLATAIFEASEKDARISEALKLYQDTENQWADVYDIIDVLRQAIRMGNREGG